MEKNKHLLHSITTYGRIHALHPLVRVETMFIHCTWLEPRLYTKLAFRPKLYSLTFKEVTIKRGGEDFMEKPIEAKKGMKKLRVYHKYLKARV